jgi:hypothetical protein
MGNTVGLAMPVPALPNGSRVRRAKYRLYQKIDYGI